MSRAVQPFILICASAVLLGACSKSSPPLRELSLGLSWIHQAQFSGPYYAEHHGLYKKEGLRVQFTPATIESDPLEEFLAGKYDIVIAQPDSLIKARAKGHAVTAIAATFRIHPLVFVSSAANGIKTPADFRGKKVGVAYSEKLILEAMLSKAGIEPDEVSIVKREYDFKSLQSGKIDIQGAWYTDELQTARQAGLQLDVVSPYDYGVTFYGDLFAVRESLLAKEPELVEKFLRATLRGWAAALQDPEKNAELTVLHDPKLDRKREALVLKASAPLIHTGHDQIGWMRSQVWQEMIAMLQNEGDLVTVPRVEDLYTMRFLHSIYGSSAEDGPAR